MTNRYKVKRLGFPEYELMTKMNGEEFVLKNSMTFITEKPVEVKLGINLAIIDIYNSSAMIGFSDHYGHCLDLVNAMNYAISCGLFEKQLQVDEKYSISNIGLELSNLRLRTFNDDNDNVFLKNADGDDIVIKYSVTDKKRHNPDLCYFVSHDIAMAFARAMNYAVLNGDILDKDTELQYS